MHGSTSNALTVTKCTVSYRHRCPAKAIPVATGHTSLHISCVAMFIAHINVCTITLLWSMHASHIFCNTNTTHKKKQHFVQQIVMQYQVNYTLGKFHRARVLRNTAYLSDVVGRSDNLHTEETHVRVANIDSLSLGVTRASL